MGDRFINGFYAFLRPTLGTWLKFAYNIKENNEKIKDLKPPFIVISNHCLNWDPFIVSIYIKQAVRYIASDNLFRSKALSFLLTHLVGAISKKKSIADSSSVKKSIRVLKRGGIIGVFPEGNRTWDGTTIDIVYSTAKFAKLAKVPVVMCKIRGGYLSRPRWSVRGRKGILDLQYYVVLDQDQLKQLSVEEIYQVLNNAVSYNEYDWQRKEMIEFKTKTPAEFLELFLYTCPKCKSIGTLKSNKDIYKCEKCGLTHKLNNYGFFVGDDKLFETPKEWGDWQYEYLKELVENKEEIFSDDGALMLALNKKGRLTRPVEGNLSLYKDRIEFYNNDIKETYMIDKIEGNTIQYNYIVEFYYNGEFRRFKFIEKNRKSVFKWNQAIDYIKDMGDKVNE